MIFDAFSILRSQLEQFIRFNSTINSADPEVVLGNIALVESDVTTSPLNNKVVLSLVSLEQEMTLKNGPTRFIDGDRFRTENRPVFSNVYILITANYPGNYSNALKRLNSVITFFQGKPIFTQANSPLGSTEDIEGIDTFKINVELYTPTFEQLNHIWGMMGGKSYPAVLYKVRMLELKRTAPQDFDVPITHISITK